MDLNFGKQYYHRGDFGNAFLEIKSIRTASPMISVFVPQKGKVFANYQKSNIKYMILKICSHFSCFSHLLLIFCMARFVV